MPENTTNKKVSDDEIDLLDLFRRIAKTLGSWIVALFRGILISIIFLIRRWLPLGLSIVAGIALSFFLRSSNKSSFTSDLVLRNNLMQIDKKTQKDNSGTTSELVSRIGKLHQFCSETNTAALSKAISMDVNKISSILDIDAFWMIDLGKDGVPDYVDYEGNHNIYDTINIKMMDRFDVRIKISSGVDLDAIRTGILKYIENDSLNQQRNQLRLKQNNELLKRINADIQSLDSLQKVKYFEETRNLKPGKEGQIVFMQEQKTQLLYTDIQFLYNKKQQIERDQDLYKTIVTVISDFSLPSRRENGLSYYGKKIIPVFFLITLFSLILIANRNNINEVFRKY